MAFDDALVGAAQFLRRHPFIKTPSDAFLAGLTHGSVEVVCLEGEEGPTLSKMSRSGSPWRACLQQHTQTHTITYQETQATSSSCLVVMHVGARAQRERFINL